MQFKRYMCVIKDVKDSNEDKKNDIVFYVHCCNMFEAASLASDYIAQLNKEHPGEPLIRLESASIYEV